MSYVSDALIDAQNREIEKLKAENAFLRACLGDGCADCAVGMGEYADGLCDPLKEENEKLRELLLDMAGILGKNINLCELYEENINLRAENARLRELVRDMWRDGMCECDERGACAECEYHYHERMSELGIELE
jgi:regulator of replication initiation timing